jgi:hypothetical protein
MVEIRLRQILVDHLLGAADNQRQRSFQSWSELLLHSETLACNGD